MKPYITRGRTADTIVGDANMYQEAKLLGPRRLSTEALRDMAIQGAMNDPYAVAPIPEAPGPDLDQLMAGSYADTSPADMEFSKQEAAGLAQAPDMEFSLAEAQGLPPAQQVLDPESQAVLGRGYQHYAGPSDEMLEKASMQSRVMGLLGGLKRAGQIAGKVSPDSREFDSAQQQALAMYKALSDKRENAGAIDYERQAYADNSPRSRALQLYAQRMGGNLDGMTAKDILSTQALSNVSADRRRAEDREAAVAAQQTKLGWDREKDERDQAQLLESINEKGKYSKYGPNGKRGGGGGGNRTYTDAEILELAGGNELLAKGLKKDPKALRAHLGKVSGDAFADGNTEAKNIQIEHKNEEKVMQHLGLRLAPINSARSTLNKVSKYFSNPDGNLPGFGTFERLVPEGLHKIGEDLGISKRSAEANELVNTMKAAASNYMKEQVGSGRSKAEIALMNEITGMDGKNEKQIRRVYDMFQDILDETESTVRSGVADKSILDKFDTNYDRETKRSAGRRPDKPQAAQTAPAASGAPGPGMKKQINKKTGEVRYVPR